MLQEIEFLVQKFWDNKISPTELKRLYYLLQAHREELATDARIRLELVNEEVARKLSAENSKEILQKIHKKAAIVSRDKNRRYSVPDIFKWSIAASILGVILASGIWFNNSHGIAGKKMATIERQTNIPMQSVVNTASRNLFFTLQDSSIVELTPGSGITYYQPFINQRRDISLSGTAFFKVAKDKSRPFTVYANGISTTAVGTQFWVYANTPDSTKVRLIEGKVVIKANSLHGIPISDVYLKPGQQFSYDKLTNSVAVRGSIEPSENGHPPSRDNKIYHTKPIVFNNEPLENVLRKFEQIYKQPVAFQQSDVKDLAFTGTFLPTDDLSTVLSALCNMNGLSFEITEAGITINKHP